MRLAWAEPYELERQLHFEAGKIGSVRVRSEGVAGEEGAEHQLGGQAAKLLRADDQIQLLTQFLALAVRVGLEVTAPQFVGGAVMTVVVVDQVDGCRLARPKAGAVILAARAVAHEFLPRRRLAEASASSARSAQDVDAALQNDYAVTYPGMQAEVMILTGRNTLMSYLFEPLAQTIRRAFRET